MDDGACHTCAIYFIAKYDTDLLSKEKALGKKRPVILQLLRKCSGNPQNTASLRLKSRLAEKQNDVLLPLYFKKPSKNSTSRNHVKSLNSTDIRQKIIKASQKLWKIANIDEV